MVEWLAKLIPKNINFSPSLTINMVKINSDNASTDAVTFHKDQLIINDATKQGQELAAKIIKQLPSHIQHNDVVLEDANLENYQGIDKELSTSGFKKQFDSFKKIIPKHDLPILEIAILVKIKYQAGENVSIIKSQAVQRFGPRAGMICNLYSSDYFDTLVKPLYEAVANGEMGLDEYLSTYETLVTESPLAMFVGVGTPAEKVKQRLVEKIETNKAAEVGYLNIHGIGKQNVRLIERLLEDGDIKAMFTEDPTIQLTGVAIKVTVYL